MTSRAVCADILHFSARVLVAMSLRTWSAAPRRVVGVERGARTADDRPMTTTARPQQRYDYRLRELVHRTRDVTVATDVGVPRSTARDWLRVAPQAVVSLDVTTLSGVGA